MKDDFCVKIIIDMPKRSFQVNEFVHLILNYQVLLFIN